MPRPISWLSRLHEIRRTVAGSVRSHYERREIEQLFQVQPRAAQLLLEILPTVTIGRSRLVERQALAAFLDRIHEAEDASSELEAIRAEGGAVSRKKVRSLVRRDVDPVALDSLPTNLEVIPGQVIISFRTIEELAQTMYALARVIESDGDELALRYELHEPIDDGGPDRAEFDAMLADLHLRKAATTALK